MWNVNIRKGTIWNVKSLNQYDYNFPGMKFCGGRVLILSAYTDQNDNKIFTYLEVTDRKKVDKYYIDINKDKFAVELNTIQTGDQRALESFVEAVSFTDMNKVIKAARDHFNLHNYKEDKKPRKTEEDLEIPQQRIYKFGIDVYVTENEHVHVNDAKKILLSKEAKDDIIYNSNTEEDIRILCDKYKIYPIKAIKEIKSRLVYQHKQKEG